MNFFQNLGSYEAYLDQYPLHQVLGVDLSTYGPVDRKHVYPNFYSVDPNLHEPYHVELDDLIRLHHLIISRKVTTIMEFGIGKSTAVFDHALNINKKKHADFVAGNLRRTNSFQCYSIDNNQQWISVCKKNAETSTVKYHLSECIVSTFNGRVCTFFKNLPNICPDFIYLDGPDQFSPIGDVRGVNTRHTDRLPMSADILAIEHFLLPGTLIVVDGRTANARFLKANLQRGWSYYHSEAFDQHFFELTERPLGVYNKRQIDFCLGEEFYNKLPNVDRFGI
jgi:hypothetical protein